MGHACELSLTQTFCRTYPTVVLPPRVLVRRLVSSQKKSVTVRIKNTTCHFEVPVTLFPEVGIPIVACELLKEYPLETIVVLEKMEY